MSEETFKQTLDLLKTIIDDYKKEIAQLKAENETLKSEIEDWEEWNKETFG